MVKGEESDPSAFLVKDGSVRTRVILVKTEEEQDLAIL